jgi:hypothetical protein
VPFWQQQLNAADGNLQTLIPPSSLQETDFASAH